LGKPAARANAGVVRLEVFQITSNHLSKQPLSAFDCAQPGKEDSTPGNKLKSTGRHKQAPAFQNQNGLVNLSL
jgi:hypothetical protein